MKNSILIIPPFFDYPQIIASGLSKIFSKVKLVYSTPSGLSYRICSFFNFHSLLKLIINKHYKKIQKELGKRNVNTDFVLVVKGSIVPIWFYKWMKCKYSKAMFVEYLWDNVKTDPISLSVSQYFDYIYSFSPEDCEEYGYIYRPFFFVSHTKCQKKTIDISCFISFREDRARILNSILKSNEYLQGRRLLWHIKGSRALFIKYRKSIGSLSGFLRNDAMSYSKMNEILAESKAQIDIPHPYQVGLTTRMFESLGTKTKIITTNCQIKKYDFFNEQNILIINPDNPIIPEEWLDTPYIPVDKEIINFYSIDKFIEDLTRLSH